MANHLHYGDNLDVLREHIKTESVDIVYLDPARVPTVQTIST
jgi:site-specific DNA-adenine methylase